MNLLKIKRLKKGLSQKKLGELCSMSRSSINNVENNPNYNLSVDKAKLIGDVLGFDWQLLYEKEYRTNDEFTNGTGGIEDTKDK